MVALIVNIPRPDDAYQRPHLASVSLRSVDDVTFVYDYPETFRVPIDLTCAFYVDDEGVSPHFVATDIYVNDTKIRVEKGGAFEYGRFRVDRNGNVY